MLGDLINKEIGDIAFGVDANYSWQLLDIMINANKAIFFLLEKTAADETATILALKKLRTRMT